MERWPCCSSSWSSSARSTAEQRLRCRGSWTVHRLDFKLLKLQATSEHEPYQALPPCLAKHVCRVWAKDMSSCRPPPQPHAQQSVSA